MITDTAHHYAEARERLATARYHIGNAWAWGALNRREMAREQLLAVQQLLLAEAERDLARAARRAASTQPTADSGDEEE